MCCQAASGRSSALLGVADTGPRSHRDACLRAVAPVPVSTDRGPPAFLSTAALLCWTFSCGSEARREVPRGRPGPPGPPHVARLDLCLLRAGGQNGRPDPDLGCWSLWPQKGRRLGKQPLSRSQPRTIASDKRPVSPAGRPALLLRRVQLIVSGLSRGPSILDHLGTATFVPTAVNWCGCFSLPE